MREQITVRYLLAEILSARGVIGVARNRAVASRAGCVRGATAFSLPSSGRETLTLRREDTRRVRRLTHVLRRIVNHADQAHTAGHRRSPGTVNNLTQISLAQRLRVVRERLAGRHKVLHQKRGILHHNGACLLGGVV